ncbi:hypothetical protein CPLU01_14941 [Colletotrichum plurivorum]|uniref:Uncharacterized protein n=1 Tax=Colletotrichum plurivorum TaxID=2175906 RepID=A0A8H6JGI4_9PEZI|nr:hypothetical protein CPLU01_14941 [Colletotrichum plurivorum]
MADHAVHPALGRRQRHRAGAKSAFTRNQTQNPIVTVPRDPAPQRQTLRKTGMGDK